MTLFSFFYHHYIAFHKEGYFRAVRALLLVAWLVAIGKEVFF